MGAFDDAIAADGATGGIFLSTFGRTIERWPQGDQSRALELTAVYDTDDLTQEGSDNPGSGIRDDDGERIQKVALIDVAISQDIDQDDVLLIDGKRWRVLRSKGEDAGMRTWIIERLERRLTRKASRRDR